MSVDEIDYFAKVKQRDKWDYKLAHNAELLSANDPQDKIEFERRVSLLATHKKPTEVTRQLISFITEVEVFNLLHDLDKNPHWVPESSKQKIKAPDIYYEEHGIKTPVEVKTLHLTADELEVWANPGTSLETSPDWDYFKGCEKKLSDFFADALEKFMHYSGESFEGELYLLFMPGSQVRLRDGEDGKPLMHERIVQYAKDNLDERIRITVMNDYDKW